MAEQYLLPHQLFKYQKLMKIFYSLRLSFMYCASEIKSFIHLSKKKNV